MTTTINKTIVSDKYKSINGRLRTELVRQCLPHNRELGSVFLRGTNVGRKAFIRMYSDGLLHVCIIEPEYHKFLNNIEEGLRVLEDVLEFDRLLITCASTAVNYKRVQLFVKS